MIFLSNPIIPRNILEMGEILGMQCCSFVYQKGGTSKHAADMIGDINLDVRDDVHIIYNQMYNHM